MFSQFALHERLLKAVAELNFTEPTPVQQAAIPPALEGRDLRETAQTGSGNRHPTHDGLWGTPMDSNFQKLESMLVSCNLISIPKTSSWP